MKDIERHDDDRDHMNAAGITWLPHKRQQSQRHVVKNKQTNRSIFIVVATVAVPLCVQQVSGSDDTLDQSVRPHRLLRRRLGAGVRVAALLVAHGFHVAAAPHAATWDLVILAVARVATPVVLRHLPVEMQRVISETFFT